LKISCPASTALSTTHALRADRVLVRLQLAEQFDLRKLQGGLVPGLEQVGLFQDAVLGPLERLLERADDPHIGRGVRQPELDEIRLQVLPGRQLTRQPAEDEVGSRSARIDSICLRRCTAVKSTDCTRCMSRIR